MSTKRTLKEILDTPIVIEGETGRFINALGGGIETAASWYPMFSPSSCERCRELLAELDAIANAPAPDANAVLLDALRDVVFTASKLWGDVVNSPNGVTVTHPIIEAAKQAIANAPDVNAALVANEECQELLAEVKAQNGVLLDALKEVRLDLENRTKGDFDALSPRVQVLLVDAIANAEASQRPAHAELLGFFAEVSPQPLTPREEMERDTA